LKARCGKSAKGKDRLAYSGRGIKVCDEWIASFEAFRDWAISSGFEENLEIDRINNDGNYEPGNCRWATRLQQQQNRRHIAAINNFSDMELVEELKRRGLK